MKQFNNGTIKSNGVTLIEVLAAVAIFSIIIAAISGLFISAIRSQGRVLATQELLDQTSYSIEYMGRAIRMARKELNCTDQSEPSSCDCLQTNGYGYNYELTTDGIRFIDYKGICTEFILEGGQIKKSIGSDTWPLTSTELWVNSFNLNLSGIVQPSPLTGDYLQPRVTIFLDISCEGTTGAGQPKIQIQTSISQRSLDVQY